MYENFEKLRAERGVSVYRVAMETGISQATFTCWKAGAYTPKIEKLKKIADYFGVPLSYLLGTDSDQPNPSAPGRPRVNDEDIKFALFDGAEGVTDDMYEEVKAFAEFVKMKYEKGKK